MSQEKLNEHIQSPTIYGVIELYEVDLSHVGMGTLRFTTDISRDNQPISFGGKMFLPVPIVAEGFEQTSSGSQSRPVITLAANSIEITSLLLSGEGIQGSKFRRIRTLERFLDSGEDPDGNAYFRFDEYIIDRIAEWKAGDYVKFELVNALDLENVGVPNRRISKYYCDNVYRLWNAKDNVFQYGKYNACPYVANVYYNLKNEIVQNPHEDVCNKTVNACELRFGKGNVLPFGGYPGTAPQGR